MAFAASIDRQLELQLAGSCMKIAHHTAWHRDAQVSSMDCPLWMKRNKMKGRLMCFVCCALDVPIRKTGKIALPCQFTPCVLGRWEPGAGALGSPHILFSCGSSTQSSPGMYTAACFRHVSKIAPFFQQSFCLFKAFRNCVIPSVWLQTHFVVSIAQTCPLHNCSHLGKAVVKPSTVLESPGLLHNSAPKFGLSFTG